MPCLCPWLDYFIENFELYEIKKLLKSSFTLARECDAKNDQYNDLLWNGVYRPDPWKKKYVIFCMWPFLCFYTRTCDYAQMSPKELEYISSYDWLCHWPSWKVLRQDLSRSLGRTSFDHLCLVSKSKTKVSCVLSPFVGPPCISLYQVSQAVTAIIGFLRPPAFKRWLNEAKTSRTFAIHVYLACFAY